MTEHLLECPISIGDMSVTVDGVTSTVFYYCACPSLRRCEERMRESWYEVQSETWVQGYAAGLDAAREAVVAMPLTGGWTTPDGVIEEIDKAKTVAAIDALRRESDV